MNLKCDYLVIGAGAASLAFIDTLLTELPSAKVILVDKNPAPGGHWVHDYDYVQLHQTSLLYGISSKQLEGNWLKLMFAKRTLPWNHRATKEEILLYFQSFVDEKVSSGQLEYYPECEYKFATKSSAHQHKFTSLDGKSKYDVSVREKLVNGILGECKIPSQCPPLFPVDEEIKMITPNQLYELHNKKNSEKGTNEIEKKYCVLGAGKTAMDAVVYLQRTMKINPSKISWVIPNDVWMLRREGGGGPWSYPRAILDAAGDREKACRALEEKGTFVRLDKNVTPTRFRFPVIGKDELKLLQKVPNIIRKGRVTSIASAKENKIKVSFSEDQDPLLLSSSDGETVFVHCTSPGPFNGKEIDELFVSDEEMRLFLIFAPPVSISLSVLAKLESVRKKGTLDEEFGNELLRAGSLLRNGDIASAEDILRHTVRGFVLEGDTEQLGSLKTLAVFLALADKDPMVPYQWLKQNRLSFFSIPGFKCGIVDDLSKLIQDGSKLGYPEEEIKVFELLHKKLSPLKGL